MCSQDPFFGTNKIGPSKTNRVNGPLKAKVFYLRKGLSGEGVILLTQKPKKLEQ